MHLAIHGICGHMGKSVLKLAKVEEKIQSIVGIDTKVENLQVPIYKHLQEVPSKIDVLIDFSASNAIDSILSYAQEHSTPIVLATTGYSTIAQNKIEQTANKIAIFQSANFSIGMHIFTFLAQKASKLLGKTFDIEIIEKHHKLKKDAPSGTALMLAKTIQKERNALQICCSRNHNNWAREANEIGIHAVRGGNIVGEHEVLFCGNDEVISLKHSATSKSVFAQGALQSALFLQNKPAGLYSMQNMLQETLLQ